MAKVKGILLSLMAILLVSGMMGVAYAKSDTINNQKNFSHQKIDLKLKDQDEHTWRNGVSATWTAINMAPGDEFAFDKSFVGLRSDFPGKVEISCNYTVEEEFPQTEADTDPDTDLYPDEMAKHMVITRASYGDIDLLSDKRWRIRDVDDDGRITFYDLKQRPVRNLPSPGDGTYFEMSVKFHEAAGNDFQGDIFNLTMIFTLKPGQAKGKAH